MNKTERIIKTEEYVKKSLEVILTYPNRTNSDYEYRLHHSFRVANICAQIAEKEQLDVEKAYIGGLLHDIGYVNDYDNGVLNYKDHGRDGAKIARDFLNNLGYNQEDVNEICYGIAIHVDDKADFEGKRTVLALTIGDSDNIDRYDAYRIYENLNKANFDNLSIDKQNEHVDKYLNGLANLLKLKFSSKTAQIMWKEKIEFYIEFYEKLKHQIDISR